VAPDTVCGTSAADATGPSLCLLNQSLGTAATAWIVQGRHFAPGTVKVSLIWQSPPQQVPRGTYHRTAPARPAVASDGTLRLDINRLFPSALRLGQFTVQVTGSDGRTISTGFIVIPQGA
jgi:hypothetical protein